MCFFVPLRGSKNKLRAELNIARVVALRRHQTKRCIRRCRRPGIQAHARSEVRMVERIQRLSTKLDPAPLSDTEILREPEVRNGVWLVAQVLECRRNVADAKASQRHETRRFDRRSIDTKLPTLAIAITQTTHDRRNVAREVQIVCQHKRLATLPFVSSI